MNNLYSYDAPFPEMRSAYLRAIARAWRDPAYKKKLHQESAGPRGVLPMLEEEFRFVFPFNVKLIINTEGDDRPTFQPAATTGWYGFADAFTLWMPARPKEKDQAADVLARYCAEFPSLLGKGLPGIQAPSDFAQFGLITARLVALVWDPRHEQTARSLFKADDARGIVEDAMACIIPWNFKMQFKPYEKGGPSSTDDAYWANFPRTEILLNLPNRPDISELEAIALASYNATGGAYPFSCG